MVTSWGARHKAMNFAARSPAEIEAWRENDIEAVANNEIEGIQRDALSDAFFCDADGRGRPNRYCRKSAERLSRGSAACSPGFVTLPQINEQPKLFIAVRGNC